MHDFHMLTKKNIIQCSFCNCNLKFVDFFPHAKTSILLMLLMILKRYFCREILQKLLHIL